MHKKEATNTAVRPQEKTVNIVWTCLSLMCNYCQGPEECHVMLSNITPNNQLNSLPTRRLSFLLPVSLTSLLFLSITVPSLLDVYCPCIGWFSPPSMKRPLPTFLHALLQTSDPKVTLQKFLLSFLSPIGAHYGRKRHHLKLMSKQTYKTYLHNFSSVVWQCGCLRVNRQRNHELHT